MDLVQKKKMISFFREWGMILVIVVIAIIATAIRPAFISGANLMNILRAYSTVGIASIGMAFTIIGGGMDLSIGSTISLTAVLTMLIVNGSTQQINGVGVIPSWAAIVVLLVGLLVGAVVGAINGGIMALVNGGMAESFIITYAMQIVVGAIAQAVVKGYFQAALYKQGLFKQFGIGIVPVIFFAVVALIANLILSKTNFGRGLYFLGANMRAAKFAGIKTKFTRFMSHVICGMCAGLAGVLIVSRVNSASVLQGSGYEFDAMVCVAVGGTSLDGGSGSIVKVVLGTMVIGFLLTALNVLGVQSNAQWIVRGVVIVLSVTMDTFNKKAKLKEVAK